MITRADSYILNVINKVKNTTKSTEKIKILKQVIGHRYENDFLRIVVATYNPYINFYIKGAEMPLFGAGTDDICDPHSLELLRKLSTREISGNNAKRAVDNLMVMLSHESRILLNLILDKSFGAGMSEKTINKVWPCKIPEFNIMLCHPYNDKTASKIKYPCFVQVKYDASRIVIIVKPSGEIKYLSRNGKPYNINNKNLDKYFFEFYQYYLDNISEQYNQELLKNGIVLDGELFSSDGDRLKSNAVATKFIRNTASLEDNLNVKIVLWDSIPLDCFSSGMFNVSYKDRMFKLMNACTKVRSKYIAKAETLVVDNIEEINEFTQNVIKEGGEGSVVKNLHGVWVNKRSYDSIKFKLELESELQVIEIVEGQGKYKNKTGALLCESSDGELQVSVGTGLNDEFRENSWKNQSALIGRIITVRHNGYIENKKGEYSLYLPRFIEVRFDKGEADSLSKIIEETKKG